MSLQKAKIYVRKNGKFNKSPLEVMFNPAEYTVKHQNEYQEFVESDCISQVFVRQRRPTLTMDLFLDTSETNTSVRDSVNEILQLMDALDKKQPTVCRFSWGKFSFDGVLISANQEYTMFLASGIPVRATIQAQFVYYKNITAQK